MRCQVCAPVLTNLKFALFRCSPFLGLQRFSITLKRRQRAKIKIILALCQKSKSAPKGRFYL
ncbi:hypothetical protein C9414_02150 [Bacillus sp. Nf3]|nr:hypothetical protein C9414_02150 [Bacillus sp. Nf3]